MVKHICIIIISCNCLSNHNINFKLLNIKSMHCYSSYESLSLYFQSSELKYKVSGFGNLITKNFM